MISTDNRFGSLLLLFNVLQVDTFINLSGSTYFPVQDKNKMGNFAL